ncbi:MAG: hypothetical protein Fur0012_05570 [Elusimicrobiota bacterium]
MKIFFLSALLSASLHGAEITGCSFSTTSANVELSFAGVYSVKNVELKDGKIVMPAEENKGRIYENIRILSRQTYEKIFSVLKTRKCQAVKSPRQPDFRLRSVKKLKSEYRIANAQVEFDSDIVVVFGVIKNYRGELSVSLPKDFVFLNDNFAASVKKKIISETEKLNSGGI